MSEQQYTVGVSNTFGANSPEDAVSQMVLWIEEVARHAGYRWVNEDETGLVTGFIDADSIDELNSFGPVDIMGYYEADENAISATLGTEEGE